jgi:cardiolipin synthase
MRADFVAGNRVTLLECGSAYFPALIGAIDAARTEVHFETYIFEADATGRLVAAALSQAARRGVRVRVLVDGFGARDFMSTLGKPMTDEGVEVMVYRPPVSSLRLVRHGLRRLHRKLVVVDGSIAFVGGINVIDDDNTPGQLPPRYDYAVSIEGPLLDSIHASVRRLWRLVRWSNLRHRISEMPRRLRPEPACGAVAAAFVVRDNLRHRRDIEDAYLEAIGAAHHEIVLAHAYFLPGQRFRHALMAAARRGVRVVVILQGRVEYVLLHYASQALYGALLEAGVHIFEYRKSFLHAKVGVVDSLWATVGSSNIDPFSLMLAREANVLVHDRGFAVSLRASLQAAMERGAVEVRRDHWRRKSPLLRAVNWLAYGMVRLLTGLAGYGMK